MENDGEGKKFAHNDKFLNALSAFGISDLSEHEHYVLFLTSRLFDMERAYEEQMDRLRETCTRLYGDTRGMEIYQRLLDA